MTNIMRYVRWCAISAIVIFLCVVALGEARSQTIFVVHKDFGGPILQRLKQLESMRNMRGLNIEIRGVCYSACTMFLFLPRDRVCVGRGARLGFHSAIDTRTNQVTPESVKVTKILVRKYPTWVRSWILRAGGLEKEVKVMPYHYASRFMRVCGGVSGKNG